MYTVTRDINKEKEKALVWHEAELIQSAVYVLA